MADQKPETRETIPVPKEVIESLLNTFSVQAERAVYAQCLLTNSDDYVVWSPMLLMDRLMRLPGLASPEHAENRRWILTLASVAFEYASQRLADQLTTESIDGKPNPDFRLWTQEQVSVTREVAARAYHVADPGDDPEPEPKPN